MTVAGPGGDSVTVVITRTVRPGKVPAYEAWLREVSAVAGHFAGHQGLTVIRPSGGSREYTLVFRFDTIEHLQGWDDSAERRALVATAEALCESLHRQEAHGVEAWFALPGGPVPRPPPKWKMSVVSWLVAFPTIQILNATLGLALAAVHPLLRGAAIGLAMIAFMTYAAMPAATRVFGPWLFPARRAEGSR